MREFETVKFEEYPKTRASVFVAVEWLSSAEEMVPQLMKKQPLL
jgi:hypothetical protein